MKVEAFLSLAFVASAFVIQDPEAFEALSVQHERDDSQLVWNKIKNPSKAWNDLDTKFAEAVRAAKQGWEDTVDTIRDTTVRYGRDSQSAFAAQAWLDSIEDAHPPPGHSLPPLPPLHPPHQSHDHRPEKTVYEIIAASEYTTKFTAAIDQFPDLVEILNSTKDALTVFVPIDRAWDKIPDDAPKPSGQDLKNLLLYHISPDLYPIRRILGSRTIPSYLKNEFMGNNPQRLSTQFGLTGLTLNFYSHLYALDVFGTNGVVHGINSILLPPPTAVDIISYLPGQFSTLELGLINTGLHAKFNNTNLHEGGTLFAPPNLAFQLLGPRINAFLFSEAGLPYLKSLLLYHVGRNVTLYSDAIYWAHTSSPAQDLPRGLYHVSLPSFLKDKNLNIDIARFARLANIRVNGYIDAVVLDGIAKDGVIHVVPLVLVPPATPGGMAEAASDLSLEELIERLDPYVM